MEAPVKKTFSKSFKRIQKIMTRDLLSYKSIFTVRKLQNIKPQLFGKYYIKVNDDENFKLASMQVHRMMITAKISKFKTGQNFIAQDLKINQPSNQNLMNPGNLSLKSQSGNMRRIQIFLPEWFAELTDSNVSISDSPSEEGSLVLEGDSSEEGSEEEDKISKVIVLRNMAGAEIKIASSSSKETRILWLYIYCRSFRGNLPDFLEKKTKNELEENFLYKFKNKKNFEGYEVSAISLNNPRQIKEKMVLWLFRMNIEKIRNLTFDKFSMMCIDEGNLVFCELRTRDSFQNSVALYRSSDPENVQLLIYKLKEVFNIFQNLASRNIFVSEEFNFENFLHKKGMFYLKSFKGLVLIPELKTYSKEVLKVLIAKFHQVSKMAKIQIQTTEVKKNLELINEIYFKVSFGHLKSLKEVVDFIRVNYVDLRSSQENNLLLKKSTDNFVVNTLDRKLEIQKTKSKDIYGLHSISENPIEIPPTRKNYKKNNFLSNVSEDQPDFDYNDEFDFDIEERINVNRTHRMEQRMRSLKFKNKFME